MTDQEMLLAMSNLFDAKLEPLKKEMQDMKHSLEVEIGTVKNSLEAQINSVKNSLEAEISSVKNSLETEISSVKNSLEAEIRNIKLTLENEIVPRLETTENCYTTTYERYASGINTLDGLKADVEILKKVAAEHSRKLQSIS